MRELKQELHRLRCRNAELRTTNSKLQVSLQISKNEKESVTQDLLKLHAAREKDCAMMLKQQNELQNITVERNRIEAKFRGALLNLD